ncbi:MAG: metallophosphoesterase [Deltaproteobacteria bacterium]|nr:metallophosphoesterase [Deltaproteobacteria bacterium]
MRILHTGDLNIKEKMDQTINENVLKFISEVKDSDADLLVVAGDIVESGLEDDYYEAIEIFNRISIEKVFIPGNRDFFNGGNVCFSSCFYELESALDPPPDPMKQRRNGNRPLIIDKDYILVGICTPRRDVSTGVIGHGQKQLTENLFKRYGVNKYKILLMHHHLLPIPIGGLEGNIINDVGDIIRIISDLSVDLVLTGHQHHPWVSEYSSGVHNKKFTTILTCGTPTMNAPRGFRFNSYNVIDIDEQNKKLNNAYVKIVTGKWSEKQMIPMNEFVKISPQTRKDFLKSDYARYLENI